MTMHAFLAAFLLLAEPPPTLGSTDLSRLFEEPHSPLSCPLFVSPFVAAIYLLGQRPISRHYLDLSKPHSSALLEHLSSCAFRTLQRCEFCPLLLLHKVTYLHLLPPPPEYAYWCASFLFFWQAHGAHHGENKVSAFSRSPLGRVKRFHSY